ncbi:Transcriptional regulator, MarR family [Labilithrix luteola]|uniref:Transcriptional regulator, MarR family n=1 Tax=Labilithrix luteola TaxID=1391654 RepID=A0A0K1QET8_9BACT|nr:MarR family winged helix-turn-helix transcriptional regulator [Labilithrix luteola]AKV03950.1 Transcriptional regulator, MarR family [Labilithrix luteola]
MRDQFTSDGIILDNALAFWVHRVYQAQRNEMYRAFREKGVELTPEQWAVLVRLWESDGRAQNDLGASTFRDKATMSRMVDALERAGLVERRPSEDDARSRLVWLTRRGRELRSVLVPVARKLVTHMLEGIDEKDLVVTRRTLQHIFANLEGS